MARIVIPGWMHHITQRGNHRQPVFFGIHDRQVYLELLAKRLSFHQMSLIGYSLMENHVHLAVIPEQTDSLAICIGRTHHDFARWQNVQRNTSGHLWQNRFFSCPVEDDRVAAVLGYIELNPVRACLVESASDWEWSSARAHITGSDPTGLLQMDFWRKHFAGASWSQFLNQLAREKLSIAQIRKATATGRLLGCEGTARRLELELGKPLLPRKAGRKRRESPAILAPLSFTG